MLDTFYIYVIILGMAGVTYATREIPFILLGGRKLGDKFTLWLSFIPVSVMSALLMPELFTDKDAALFLSPDNLYIWTGIATFAVACVFKNLFVTIIFGMAFLSALRYFIG